MKAPQRHFGGRLKGLTWQDPETARGTRDDVDLREMARRAMNYFLRTPRPELDYACRFNNGLLGCPPGPQGEDLVAHGDTDVRQETALIGLRELSGVAEDAHVDEGLRRRVMGYVGDDQLSYTPYAMSCATDLPPDTRIGALWTTGWTLRSLADHHARTGDEQLRDKAGRMARRLKELAHWDTGRAYYPGTALLEGEWIGNFFGKDTTFYCPIVCDLVHYADVVGDEEIGEFGYALARGVLAGLPGKRELGPLWVREDGSFTGHTHLHTRVIWGVAAAGRVARDPVLLEWARRAYEFVRSCGTDYGWFPERTMLPGERPHDGFEQRVDVSETCCTGDMTQIAVELARAGYPHYWDHVERYVRNYLRPLQFAITPEIEAFYRSQNADRSAEEVERGLAGLRDFEGGFLSDIGVNDWKGPELFMAMAGCCVPEAARALVTAWHNTVVREADVLRVNMAFNHDSPAAVVEAAGGGVRVTPQTAGTVRVRPPAWTRRQAVQQQRADKPTPAHWVDDYVQFDDVQPGETVEVTWPVPRFEQHVDVGGRVDGRHPYTIRWEGNTVTGIEPPGTVFPMFGPV